jgi:hypothetical protein
MGIDAGASKCAEIDRDWGGGALNQGDTDIVAGFRGIDYEEKIDHPSRRLPRTLPEHTYHQRSQVNK